MLAGAGERAILWDVEALRPVASWVVGAPVVDVSLSRDGRHAWLLDGKGRAHRFDLPEPTAPMDPDLEGIPRFDEVKPPTGAGGR